MTPTDKQERILRWLGENRDKRYLSPGEIGKYINPNFYDVVKADNWAYQGLKPLYDFNLVERRHRSYEGLVYKITQAGIDYLEGLEDES